MTAAFLFTHSESQVIAQSQSFGYICKGFAFHEARTHQGQRVFCRFGSLAEQQVGHYVTQNGVPKKFEAFVVLFSAALVC